MNKEYFQQNFALIYKYFGVHPDNEKTQMYWNFLKNMEDEVFKNAMQCVIREFLPSNQNPFPLVSHFLKHTSTDAHGMAIKAISMIKAYIRKVGRYESVNFNDNTLHAVVERFGGWPAICGWSDKEWDINEGRLIESYKMSYQSGYFEENLTHLKGLSEKDCGFYKIFQIDNKTMQMIGSDQYRGLTLLTSTYKKVEQIERKLNENDSAIELEMKGFFDEMNEKFSK